MKYYFGLYHWRRRLLRLTVVLAVGLISSRLFLAENRQWKLVGLLGGGWTVWHGHDILDALLSPSPWSVETYKALANSLPIADADHIIDIGCGTGRSLVGLASAVPAACTVMGLDIFDNEIIRGNGPHLARQNARETGLAVNMLRGDATRLPIADGSQDVVTACRILHDLSADDAAKALDEAHRVCAPDGTLGVLELPIIHDDGIDPERYWKERVVAAGFTVEQVCRVPRHSVSSAYVIVVGTPV